MCVSPCYVFSAVKQIRCCSSKNKRKVGVRERGKIIVFTSYIYMYLWCGVYSR